MSTRAVDVTSRTSLRILTVAVVLTTVATIATLGAVTRSVTSEVVQGSELDLAGRQRRLSERIALDVELLRRDPADSELRQELELTARQLGAIRTGLLDGDPDLDLDGDVPTDFRRLYSPEGLDLSERLLTFERSAVRIARESGPVDPVVSANISREADGQRLVEDLNVAVESLSSAQLDNRSRASTVAIVGPLVAGLLGLAAIVTLVSVRRRFDRESAHRSALTAEIALSEDVYRTTVNSLIDGVVVQEEDGTIVQVNDAARALIARHLGDRGLVDGARFPELFPAIVGDDGLPLPHDRRPIVRALTGPGPAVGIVAGLPGEGGTTWFRCNATAFDRAPGHGRRVVLTFSDITAERTMAERLRDQERRFRQALEHAPIGTALVTGDGRFLTVNSALCRLTGCTDRELCDLGLFGLAGPDDGDLLRSMLRSVASTGVEPTSATQCIVSTGGAVIDVQIATAEIRSGDDDEPSFVVHFLDVTETVRATTAQHEALVRERQANARLVALDETRNTFVSTVSHELRTPLTSLVGYLELLDDGTAGALTEQQRRMIEAATRNGLRLGRLIDDLLSMTVAEHDASRARPDRIEIPALIAGVVETMAPLAGRSDLTVRTTPSGHDAIVLGDRSQLERVLINVVGNAVKFTPPGGTIDIATSCSADPDPVVDIVVTDSGLGIAADEQDQIFTRFFRSSEAERNHVPGTGLGLAIASKIVESHGGEISLSSVQFEGTTVTIRLPTTTVASTR